MFELLCTLYLGSTRMLSGFKSVLHITQCKQVSLKTQLKKTNLGGKCPKNGCSLSLGITEKNCFSAGPKAAGITRYLEEEKGGLVRRKRAAVQESFQTQWQILKHQVLKMIDMLFRYRI